MNLVSGDSLLFRNSHGGFDELFLLFFLIFVVVCFLIICLAHCINSWHVLCCQIGDKLTALLILTALPEQDDDEDGDDGDEGVDVELVEEFVSSM